MSDLFEDQAAVALGDAVARGLAALTVDALIERLAGFRYAVTAEDMFQAGMAAALEQLGIPFKREHPLGAAGRVDFYLPYSAIALELKVDGTPNAVLRQLHGYASSPEVSAIVLATAKSRLGSLVPALLNGKPCAVLALWKGQL